MIDKKWILGIGASSALAFSALVTPLSAAAQEEAIDTSVDPIDVTTQVDDGLGTISSDDAIDTAHELLPGAAVTGVHLDYLTLLAAPTFDLDFSGADIGSGLGNTTNLTLNMVYVVELENNISVTVDASTGAVVDVDDDDAIVDDEDDAVVDDDDAIVDDEDDAVVDDDDAIVDEEDDAVVDDDDAIVDDEDDAVVDDDDAIVDDEDGNGEENGDNGAEDENGNGEDNGDNGAEDENGNGEDNGDNGAEDENGTGEDNGDNGAEDENGTGEDNGDNGAEDENGNGEENGEIDALAGAVANTEAPAPQANAYGQRAVQVCGEGGFAEFGFANQGQCVSTAVALLQAGVDEPIEDENGNGEENGDNGAEDENGNGEENGDNGAEDENGNGEDNGDNGEGEEEEI
jgi:hypothetical protein